MFADPVFVFLQTHGVTWLIAGSVYALFDVLLNVCGCLITGGRNRLREYLHDRVGVIWAFAVLGTGTAIYVANSDLIRETTAELSRNGIDLSNYRLPVFVHTNDWLYIAVLAVGFVNSLFSFIRYHRHRRELWLAKSPIFHFIRTTLVDVPLNYFFIIAALSIVDVFAAMNQLLAGLSNVPQVLNPDGLYGLDAAYNYMFWVLAIVVLSSILPILVLIRERGTVYSQIYKALATTGLIAIVLILAPAVLNFNYALERIRSGALYEILVSLAAAQDSTQRVAALLEYQIVGNLPGSLPVPSWFPLLSSPTTILLIIYLYDAVQEIVGFPPLPRLIRNALGAQDKQSSTQSTVNQFNLSN